MTAQVLKGTPIADTIRLSIQVSADAFYQSFGMKPSLAVVLVGDNPASQSYVNIKLKRCAEIGIHAELHHFPKETDESTIIQRIDALNARSDIHGIIIQLPLPTPLVASRLIDHISPEKDVDGLHILNAGALFSGHPKLIPCTPKGILVLLQSLQVPLAGKHVVVIGRSMIVGKPMAALLLAENCTVTQVHSQSADWGQYTRLADIVIVAAGCPGILTADHIKPGAIVIDVGSTAVVTPQGQRIFVGDADASIHQVAGYVTPVPGGVGPMTVAMLLQNTLDAAWSQFNDR